MRKTIVVAALLFPLLARAQTKQIPVGEPPTPGVYNPTVGVAGDADASDIEKNPASLAFLPSWSGVYLHSELDPAQTVGGRGDGFFFAAPLPLLSRVSVGIGVQLLRPPVSFPFGDEQKFDLALAVRLFTGVALGLHYAHVWADQGAVAQGIDTLDLALTLRPARWISAALVLHDLPSPAVAQFPLQRVWEPEIALRPFSSNVIELSAGARIGERRQDVDPHFRVWIVPTAGVTLKCDLEWKRYLDLDAPQPINDIRVALGVALDLEHIGAQVFGLFGRDAGAVRAHGFTVAARISGDRYPTFWQGPVHLERIELTGTLGERKLALLTSWMRRLERNREVAGIVVVVGDVGGSWATAEELRESFARLRRAGKHVFAYVGETNTRGYFVASAAERVYQDPAGGIRLVGLSSTLLFFRGLGDLIGVRADFVKIAEYKSAPEQYLRDELVGAGAGAARGLHQRDLRAPRQRHRRVARRQARPGARLGRQRAVHRRRRQERRPRRRAAPRRRSGRGHHAGARPPLQPAHAAQHPRARPRLGAAGRRRPLHRRRHRRRQVGLYPARRHAHVGHADAARRPSSAPATTRTSRRSSCASTAPAARRSPPTSSPASWSARRRSSRSSARSATSRPRAATSSPPPARASMPSPRR